MNTPYVFRKCTKCGEWLVANNYNFGKDKKGKFGLDSRCKVCKKEYQKEFYKDNKEYYKKYHKEYYEENKDKIKEYSKQYYKDNKEYHKEYYKNNEDKIREHSKEYYKDNKEYHKEYYKKYRENNKEYYKKYQKEYYEENKEYYKEYYKENKEYRLEYQKKYCKTQKGKENCKNNSIKHINRLKSQGKGITTKQYKEMMNFFDWKCAYSNIPYEKYAIHKDYILPVAKGGLNEVWNIVPMYRNYNSSKSARIDVLNWYKEQEYFSEERLAKIVEWQQYAYDKYATEYDDPLILITDLCLAENV